MFELGSKVKNILIVTSDYYENVSKGLIKGSTDFIKHQNITHEQLKINYEIKKAPGAFEVPYLINQYKNSYDAFIAFGCIIRGETYHFEVISNEVTRKIMDLSININKPIGFGILTCENLDQAQVRSDPNKKNKGAEVAKACLDILLDEQ